MPVSGLTWKPDGQVVGGEGGEMTTGRGGGERAGGGGDGGGDAVGGGAKAATLLGITFLADFYSKLIWPIVYHYLIFGNEE